MRSPRTIGELETLAGVEDRHAWWWRVIPNPSDLTGDQYLKIGVRALLRQIRDRVNRGELCLLPGVMLADPASTILSPYQ